MTFWAGRYFLAPFLCGFLLVFTFIYLGLVKSDSIFAPIVWLGGVAFGTILNELFLYEKENK